MAHRARSLTLPWIPVGLSSLVLLALVVVLSSPKGVTSIITKTSVVNHTVTTVVTKLQIETKTVIRTTGSTSHTTTTQRSWPVVGPTPDHPLTDTIKDVWGTDAPPVDAGHAYVIQMEPIGHYTLWCSEFHYDVNSQFAVPLDGTNCRVEITGATGTTWTLRVTA